MKSPMLRTTSLVIAAALTALSGCAAANNDASIDTEGATTTPAVTTTVASTAPATPPSPAAVVPPGYESITTADGREFALGSGFSDEERRQPPPLGSTVTYRYRELTAGGLPRHASYWRQRRVE